MTIKLKDTIDLELKIIGLKPGIIIPNVRFDHITGACRFEYCGYNLAVAKNCTIWPNDNEIIKE
jgi:hypothetical protein